MVAIIMICDLEWLIIIINKYINNGNLWKSGKKKSNEGKRVSDNERISDGGENNGKSG